MNRLRTPVAQETEESPLDQSHHPHVYLLVRCLDGRQTHPSTGDTSGIRRVLYGHSVAESVKTDIYKRIGVDILTNTSPLGAGCIDK